MRSIVAALLVLPALALAFLAAPAAADPDACPDAQVVDPTEELYVFETGQCTGAVVTDCSGPLAFDFRSSGGATGVHVFTNQPLADGRCGSGALVLG